MKTVKRNYVVQKKDCDKMRESFVTALFVWLAMFLPLFVFPFACREAFRSRRDFDDEMLRVTL